MTKRKNHDGRSSPEPAPESTPRPESSPDPVGPEPAAEVVSPEVDAVPAGADPEGQLMGLRVALHEAHLTIARQAGELAVASENAELLEKSREKVKRLKERLIEAKDEASAAKKAHDAALEGHLDLERELLSGQQRLPFPPPDAPAAPAPAPSDAPAVATPALPSVDRAAAGDESWRPTPLGTLGIPDELPHSILARLEDAGIVTVGDLADFVKPGPLGPSKRLINIDGIGQAKAERIEAALDAFWAKWSEWQARQEAESAGAEDLIDPEFVETDDDLGPAAEDEDGDDQDGDDQDGEEAA